MIYIIEAYYQSDRHSTTKFWSATADKKGYLVFTNFKEAQKRCKELNEEAKKTSFWGIGLHGNDYPTKIRVSKVTR